MLGGLPPPADADPLAATGCGARGRTMLGFEPTPPSAPHREEPRQVKVLAEKKKLYARPSNH